MEFYYFSTETGHFGAFWRAENSVGYYFPLILRDGNRKQDFSMYMIGTGDSLLDENDFISFAIKNVGCTHPVALDSITKSVMPVNGYFSRVWRGVPGPDGVAINPIPNAETYGSSYISSVVAAGSIFDYLMEIFRFIDPGESNMGSYGARLRELLILTCTEVESLWKGVLRANSSIQKKRYFTSDYCKLCDLLRLKEWSVFLKDYPGLGDFSPFLNWDADNPTQSLVWYEAYNSVKHDRENAANQATLKNLISAVAPMHILNASQWGPEIYQDHGMGLKSPFSLRSSPKFKSGDFYAMSREHGEPIAIKYFDLIEA